MVLGVVVVLIALVIVALIQYLPAYNALQQGRTDVLGAETILRSAGLDPSADQLAAATSMLDGASRTSVRVRR